MRFAPRSHQENMESTWTKGGNIASEAGSRIWRRSNLGKSCMCCKEDRSRRQEAEAQGLREESSKSGGGKRSVKSRVQEGDVGSIYARR
jgi:hypothetical protein